MISFIAFKIYQKRRRVPEGIKNVPTLSYMNFLIQLFKKSGPDKRWENAREILEKEGIGRVIFLYHAVYSFF